MVAISILNRVTKSDIVTDPFPHILIENVLPPDYFLELENGFPKFETVAGDGPHPNNHVFGISHPQIMAAPHSSGAWREFTQYHCSEAFYREVIELFDPHFQTTNPDIEQRRGRKLSEFTVGIRSTAHRSSDDAEATAHDVKMDVQLCFNSPVLECSSVRSAHVDSRHKLFAGLLYFRDPRDTSEGGQLELYRYDPKSATFDLSNFQFLRGEIETARTVPYKANTLVMWVNSLRSLHGVSPRSITNIPRRYVNLLCETYKEPGGLYHPPTARVEVDD